MEAVFKTEGGPIQYQHVMHEQSNETKDVKVKVKVSYLTWIVYESPHLVWMERLISNRVHTVRVITSPIIQSRPIMLATVPG